MIILSPKGDQAFSAKSDDESAAAPAESKAKSETAKETPAEDLPF